MVTTAIQLINSKREGLYAVRAGTDASMFNLILRHQDPVELDPELDPETGDPVTDPNCSYCSSVYIHVHACISSIGSSSPCIIDYDLVTPNFDRSSSSTG